MIASDFWRKNYLPWFKNLQKFEGRDLWQFYTEWNEIQTLAIHDVILFGKRYSLRHAS